MLPNMDPEKFRLASEGITGESKGPFFGRAWFGCTSAGVLRGDRIPWHVMGEDLRVLVDGLFPDDFGTEVLPTPGMRELLRCLA